MRLAASPRPAGTPAEGWPARRGGHALSSHRETTTLPLANPTRQAFPCLPRRAFAAKEKEGDKPWPTLLQVSLTPCPLKTPAAFSNLASSPFEDSFPPSLCSTAEGSEKGKEGKRRGKKEKRGASPSHRHPEAEAALVGAAHVKGKVVRVEDTAMAEQGRAAASTFISSPTRPSRPHLHLRLTVSTPSTCFLPSSIEFPVMCGSTPLRRARRPSCRAVARAVAVAHPRAALNLTSLFHALLYTLCPAFTLCISCRDGSATADHPASRPWLANCPRMPADRVAAKEGPALTIVPGPTRPHDGRSALSF
jgi:hypothetical protein